ncbi:MAG: hypothetical protein JO184_13280 [Gammaproteobacteria bacterium]|nr:hypothetical protein [Gammaproteobacteria bacterium]MBV8306269.1 hypothetical protein [Gammaproteobacteria bacterium]
MKGTGASLTTLEDFIVGRLSDDQQQAFEDRLLREPALVGELEQSLRLREGLRALRQQGYFAEGTPRRSNSRLWAPVLAAAAVAGLALFLSLSRLAGPSPILLASPGSVAAGVGSSITAHFRFVAARGSSVPSLDLPAAGLIEIDVAPGTDETGHRYRMVLVHQQEGGSAKTVSRLEGLAMGADGYVHGYADASRLAPGRYIIRLEADTDTAGTAEVFPFNLRAGLTESSR